MVRTFMGIVAGLIAWTVIGACGLFVLRLSWPAYALAETQMTFTLAMQISRLAVSVASSVGGGWLAATIAGQGRAAWWLGVLLVIIFIPIHYSLWNKFPAWYHLTFLLTLAPIVGVSGRLAGEAGGQHTIGVAR